MERDRKIRPQLYTRLGGCNARFISVKNSKPSMPAKCCIACADLADRIFQTFICINRSAKVFRASSYGITRQNLRSSMAIFDEAKPGSLQQAMERGIFRICQGDVYIKANELELHDSQSKGITHPGSFNASKHMATCASVFFSTAKGGRCPKSKKSLAMVSMFSWKAPPFIEQRTNTLHTL